MSGPSGCRLLNLLSRHMPMLTKRDLEVMEPVGAELLQGGETYVRVADMEGWEYHEQRLQKHTLPGEPCSPLAVCF